MLLISHNTQFRVAIWIFAALTMIISSIEVEGQIDDIILDLDDPEDYVDQVVAIFEKEQAERERRQVETAARCRARCLADNRIPSVLSRQEALTLDRCLTDKDCSANFSDRLVMCLSPCDQPFVNLAYCEHACQDDSSGGCEDSCYFLQNINSQRPGQCPQTGQLTAYGVVCTEACIVDGDCPAEDQKCCSNGCGHICSQPSYDQSGMPLVPTQLQLRELPAGVGVRLDWSRAGSGVSSPVVYIVWVRYNVGKHHSEAHATHWQQITQTTLKSTILRDIRPGHWYEFQVSAVNINGTRGACVPTQPFSLSREPAPPGIPVNLTTGDTLVQGNHVTVSVQWKHPIDSDLPVSRYKIFWNKLRSKHPLLSGDVREHRQFIHGDLLQFDVPDLDPESTYLVQIQAICQYGDTRLKSDKASIYINTYPHQGTLNTALTTTAATPVVVQQLQTPRPLSGVKAGMPFFQSGLLRVNITWYSLPETADGAARDVLLEWTPDACIADSSLDADLPKQLMATTTAQNYVLYELRFDCRYEVRILPISYHGALGQETRLSFITPSCDRVRVIGDVAPDCPTSVPNVPEEPGNLHLSYIHADNISALLSWEEPPSDSPITSYRVTWGRTLAQQTSTWDKNQVLTKVLSKDVLSFQLHNLCEAVTYLVRIQALSKIGPGRVATSSFTVPNLGHSSHRDSAPLIQTPYNVLDHRNPDNQVMDNYPITSHPHSWQQNRSSCLHPVNLTLQTILVFLTFAIVAVLGGGHVQTLTFPNSQRMNTHNT